MSELSPALQRWLQAEPADQQDTDIYFYWLQKRWARKYVPNIFVLNNVSQQPALTDAEGS